MGSSLETEANTRKIINNWRNLICFDGQPVRLIRKKRLMLIAESVYQDVLVTLKNQFLGRKFCFTAY